MEHKQSGGNIQLPYQIMIKDIVINKMSLSFLIICQEIGKILENVGIINQNGELEEDAQFYKTLE